MGGSTLKYLAFDNRKTRKCVSFISFAISTSFPVSEWAFGDGGSLRTTGTTIQKLSGLLKSSLNNAAYTPVGLFGLSSMCNFVRM